ncbi:MAG: hypothetical protein V1794_14995, partial [Candidatus Glassbacteria bacterium]
AKIGEIYELYGKRENLTTATAPGGHADKEAIRLPVYQFFLKQFLGQDVTLTQHGPVDTLAGAELVCYRNGFPTNERLTRIHDEFMPRPVARLTPVSAADRKKLAEGRAQELRTDVFNYFPARSAAPVPAWGEERVIWGRRIREVTFEGFPGLKVTGTYSLPEHPTEGVKMPAVLVVKDERLAGWFPDVRRSEGYDWGNRAVLAIEVLDNGRRAVDDSLRHQMIREANIIGYCFDGMRVYEILRAVDLLRGLPEVDPQRIALFGKKALGVNCLYAGLLDGNLERVIVESPTASHTQGPYYLGILTHTDIPEVAWLMADKLKLIGEVPVEIAEALQKSGSQARWSYATLAECIQ